MFKPAATINAQVCQQATDQSVALLWSLVQRALYVLDESPSDRIAEMRWREVQRLRSDLLDDPDHDRRVQQNYCRACFYPVRVAGAAITQRCCGLCGQLMTFGSTDTDVICKDCACAHAMCAHCGGDRESDLQRREYPGPEANLGRDANKRAAQRREAGAASVPE